MAPYLVLKALHVAAALLFVAGVIHASLVRAMLAGDDAPASEVRTRVAAQARLWDRRVTSPAMLAVWALGIGLAVQGGWFRSPWLMLKLALVVALSAIHGMQSGALRRIALGGAARPPMTALAAWAAGCAVLIALLVVLKPFA